MKKNRTSSFPADKKNKTEDKIVFAFIIPILAMASAAHWVYTEKDAVSGILMMALVTGACACLALYRWVSTKNKNNNSAGT